jgi:hypothetical protein
MRSYCWQHILRIEPVDPPWALRRADILTPAIVGVRANAMDRDNAACELSMTLDGRVLLERTYSTISSTASAGASRITSRPMSSSVTCRT